MQTSVVRRLSTFSNDFSSDSFHISYTASKGRWGTNNCVFKCSGRMRTLVAMATYSFHRLIMGKVEISDFFVSIFGFLAHLSRRRLIGELIVYEGIRRPSVVRRLSSVVRPSVTFSNDIFSEAMRPILFIFHI